MKLHTEAVLTRNPLGVLPYFQLLMQAQIEGKQDMSFQTQGLSVRFMLNTNRQSYFDVSRFYNPFYYTTTGYEGLSNEFRLVNINPAIVAANVAVLFDEKIQNTL